MILDNAANIQRGMEKNWRKHIEDYLSNRNESYLHGNKWLATFLYELFFSQSNVYKLVKSQNIAKLAHVETTT